MTENSTPKRPWWLRAGPWRWLVRVVVLLLFLVLGAVVYLLLYPPSLEPFEKRIEAVLSKRLDRPVSYGGLDWVWEGDLRVRMRGLDLDDGAIRVQRLLLGVDIWALLAGDPRFSDLVLEGVQAELPFPAPAEEGQPAEGTDREEILGRLGGLATRFDRVAVRDLRLAFTGPHVPPGAETAVTEARFELERRGGGYWLDVSAGWAGARLTVGGRIDHLGPDPARWRLDVQGRAADLDLARLQPLLPEAGPASLSGQGMARVAVEGRPLDGEWSAEGEARLSGIGMRWPEQMTREVSGWDLETGVRFQKEDGGRELSVTRLSLGDGAAAMDGSGRLAWGGERSEGPWLETDLELGAAPVEAYRPLYRLAVVPEGLRQWLDEALVAGRLGKSRVVIDGPLADLPYPRDRGTLRVRVPVSGLHLRYLSGWLPVTDAQGVLTVDRERLRFAADGGRILSSPVQELAVTVGDLTARNPVLRLEGDMALDMADGAEFLVRSPLLEPGALGPVQPVGPARLHLGLRAVLGPAGAEVPENRVRTWGQVDLQDAAVDLGGGRDPLVKLRGTVAFDGRRLNADPITGEFRGQPVTATVRTASSDAPWRFHAETALPGRDLQEGLLPGLSPRLLGWLQMRLEGALQPDGRGSYRLGVDLTEAALVLPDPLFKAMGQSGTLAVSGRLGEEAYTEVDLRYPGARWAFSVTERGGDRHLGGAVGLNRPPPELERDQLTVAGELGELRLQRWLDLFREVGAAMPPAGEARPWQPVSLDVAVTTEALRWRDTDLGRVALAMQGGPSGAGFQGAAQIGGDRLEGSVRWERPNEGRPSARVTMERVNLSGLGGRRASEKGEDSAQRDPAAAPVPASAAPELDLDLEVVVERFIHERLVLEDYHLGARLYPDRWALENLEATVAGGSRFYLDGEWRRDRGTQLTGSLRTADFGRLLNRTGLYPSMRGGRGRFSGGVSWAGPPWAFDPGRLQGGFAARIADGRLKEFTFLSKALATLNILDLPQQVLGGFKELRGSGLHFRFLEGSALLEDGVLTTEDWRLESAPLRITIRGGLDLGRRRYDLHLRAQPLQTLDQVVAAIPLLGYLVTGKDKAFTDLQYHVTGPWSDPVVQAPLPQKEKGFWQTFYERIRAMEWRDLVPWRRAQE